MTTSAKKILIVEDERLIAKPLALKLRFAGFEVANAYDGEEALLILEKEKFDLILLDLLMPKVDGFEFLSRLRSRGDQTSVIVASNLNQEKDISRVLELGVTSYYVKTDTSLDEIVDNVKAALRMA
ncbi:MAG TPA: response regulator [Candidatus Nanoarchaeia archaeon]|nr:response regulator [Candidatus Nanoarchaeia archaeon]